MRQLLGVHLGTTAPEIEFAYGPHGKPALSQKFAGVNLRFNLSHSGEIAIYGFSIGRELGVDVEALRPLSDADDIVARFFSRAECEAYRRLAAIDRTAGFFNCWTRKEALIKALGDGLYYSLKNFDVSLAPEDFATVLRLNDVPGERCGWSMGYLDVPGFAAAVVVENFPCHAAPPERVRDRRSTFPRRAIAAVTAWRQGGRRDRFAYASP